MDNKGTSSIIKSYHTFLATPGGEPKRDPAAAGSVAPTSKAPKSLHGARPAWLRYLVAMGCVVCALGIRLLLSPLLGDELPFLLLIAAALVAGWFGGIMPGITSLLLGLVVGDYFYVHGALFRWSDPTNMARLLRYLFTASLGVVLLEVLHRAHRRTQTALEAAERENVLRRRSEAALLEAKNQLALLTSELEKRVVQRTAELTAYVESLRGVQYHMVHHMRAPLRAMCCYSNLLVEKYADKLDSTALGYCNHISKAAGHMDRLILDLMQYAQLGHEQLCCAQISFAHPLHRALNRLAAEMRNRDARIELTGPWPTVYADPVMLEKVLFNLLQNAIRFVAQGVAPLTRVWPEHRGSRLRVWFEDNGIGIRPEFKELVFRPFETLHPWHVFGGNGVGLAVVREGLLQMGGDVGFEASPSGGTRFWIELLTMRRDSSDFTEPALGQTTSQNGAQTGNHNHEVANI